MGVNYASMACNVRSPFSNAPWQLEEARQIHARLEKEFSCKDEEVAQVVREHRALLERLEEESVARTRLTLELHKAEGERPAGWAGSGRDVHTGQGHVGTAVLGRAGVSDFLQWNESPLGGTALVLGAVRVATQGPWRGLVLARTSYCCLSRRPQRVTW